MKAVTVRGRVAAIVVVCFAAAACLQISQPIGIELRHDTQFEVDWKHYVKLPTSKAFALAGDVNHVHVSGLAWGEPSAEAAVYHAMRFCEERRADRRIAAACHLYALDDRVVAPAG